MNQSFMSIKKISKPITFEKKGKVEREGIILLIRLLQLAGYVVSFYHFFSCLFIFSVNLFGWFLLLLFFIVVVLLVLLCKSTANI